MTVTELPGVRYVTPRLPLPGDGFRGETVVASLWLNDDPPTPVILLLLIATEAPYYSVVEATWSRARSRFSVTRRSVHPNIVPAVEDYKQSGGDY